MTKKPDASTSSGGSSAKSTGNGSKLGMFPEGFRGLASPFRDPGGFYLSLAPSRSKFLDPWIRRVSICLSLHFNWTFGISSTMSIWVKLSLANTHAQPIRQVGGLYVQ